MRALFHADHLRNSHQCGKTIGEYLGWRGLLTHRQHVMVTWWVNEEWNRPDRGDHYLMSLNATVARLFHKSPSTVRTEHFKLEFTRKGAKRSAAEMRERIEHSKSAWMMAAGGRSRMNQVDAQGNLVKPAALPPKSTPFLGKRAGNLHSPQRVTGRDADRVGSGGTARPGTGDLVRGGRGPSANGK